MTRWILSALLLFIVPASLIAAPRSFTDQDGDSIKAEMMGVKNGQVMLKERTTVKPFALSSFSLDDRDYIIKWLKDKRHTKLLSELMQAAVTEIGGGNGNDQPGGQGAAGPRPGAAGFGAAGPGPAGPGGAPNVNGPAAAGGPAGLNDFPKALNGADSSKSKTMYTLKLPTGELVREQSNRTWTDVMGDTLTGTFDHIEANGAVVLKEGSGSTRRIPLVLFSRDDVDYLIAAFKEDLDAEVFPKGGFVAPTPAQESSGYRVWTDRRGERLAGKFVSRSGNTVTIEVAGQNKTFPFNGLSQDDKNHINSQEQKNQPQAGSQPIAAAGAGAGGGGGFPNAGSPPGFGPPGSGPSGIGARPFGPRSPSGIPAPAMPNPSTSSPTFPSPSMPPPAMPSPTMSNPAMPTPSMPAAAGMGGAGGGAGGGARPWSVPNAGSGQFVNVYEFKCTNCGHTWTRENQSTDKCPKCPGSRVRIPVGLIGKVIAGICALCGIGYGANKARGEG